MTILEDPDQNIHLKNLSLHQATTEEEALNLLFLGDTNRMIAEVMNFLPAACLVVACIASPFPKIRTIDAAMTLQIVSSKPHGADEGSPDPEK